MHSRYRRLLGRGLVIAVGLLLAIVLAQQLYYFVRVVRLAERNPETTAFMAMRRAQDQELAHEWVAYQGISGWLKRAVIAAEDHRFMAHDGFDWKALRKAMRENLKAEAIVRGGSTISQQLAKNLFLSPEQTLLRKLQEAVITVMLETVLSKRRILELYLNVIEWGDGVFGAAAAAQHYDDVPASALTRWQAAYLAARIPSPQFFDERGVTPFLRDRAGDIYRWSDQVAVPAR